MPLKNGDVILLNYACKIKENGEVVETTIESVAKEAKLHAEDRAFEPLFVVLGEGWVPKGLEESLQSLDAGQKFTVEVPPEKGYGQRDPTKIKLTPLKRLLDRGIEPVPGGHIEIDGKHALVRSVGAGRVQLDYNHPLAGKTLVYEGTVEKLIEAKEDKIKAIIHRRIPGISVEKFTLTLSEKKLEVQIPEELYFVEGLSLAKRGISLDVMKFVPELEEITFVETFRREKPTEVAAEEPKAAEGAKEAATATAAQSK